MFSHTQYSRLKAGRKAAERKQKRDKLSLAVHE